MAGLVPAMTMQGVAIANNTLILLSYFLPLNPHAATIACRFPRLAAYS
jgi:hypothetical protein